MKAIIFVIMIAGYALVVGEMVKAIQLAAK